MVCKNCQTDLPDAAIVCWKCGTPTANATTGSSAKKPDVLYVVASFFIAAVFFVCVGWTVPFTIFGMISTAASSSPQWSSVNGIASGVILVLSAIASLAALWWGSYWVITRLFAKPSG